MSLVMELPNGERCAWTGLDSHAEQWLEMLRPITGLKSGEPRKYHCFVQSTWTKEQPEDSFWVAGSYSWSFLSQNRQQTTLCCRKLGEYNDFQQYRLLRHILWLGLLPELLTSQSFLLHAALAEHHEQGILFCGPSGIGKSTICRLLPPEFTILADDCLVISRYGDEFMARPLPTWSNWLQEKTRREFDCNRTVPIKKIFLLARGKVGIETVAQQESTLAFMPSVIDMVNWHTQKLNTNWKNELYQNGFDGGYALLKKISPQGLFFHAKSLPQEMTNQLLETCCDHQKIESPIHEKLR